MFTINTELLDKQLRESHAAFMKLCSVQNLKVNFRDFQDDLILQKFPLYSRRYFMLS